MMTDISFDNGFNSLHICKKSTNKVVILMLDRYIATYIKFEICKSCG